MNMEHILKNNPYCFTFSCWTCWFLS